MKLTSIRLISEKREKDFNKLGIFEAEDLVRFYPRAYLDLTARSSPARSCRWRPSIT